MGIAARSIHGLGVCVIPNPDNDFKPLALRHKPLAAVSALLILTKLVALGVIAITPASAELSTITTSRMIQLTNAERTKVGLPALTVNSKLSQAAKEKGNDMLNNDYFAHISPAGVTPWFWINKAGYSYLIAGENLAIDFTEAEDVAAAWVASPSHRENLLRPDYTETGLAVVSGEFQGGTSTIVVHMFGKPSSAQVAAEIISTSTPRGTSPSPTPKPSPKPTPSASPTPTATPAPTPPPPSEAPRAPRIALQKPGVAVGGEAALIVSGDAGTTAHLLANNQLRQSILLVDSPQPVSVSLNNFPDGTVILRSYSSDSAGNKSALSDPLAVLKDTTGPTLATEQLVFVVAPAFDQWQAALLVPQGVLAPDGDYAQLNIIQNGDSRVADGNKVLLAAPNNFTVQIQDAAGNTTELAPIALTPAYQSTPTLEDELAAPRTFNSFTRRITASILVSMLVLLILAVIIRIRIQHPALITHASLVILLAAALFIF